MFLIITNCDSSVIKSNNRRIQRSQLSKKYTMWLGVTIFWLGVTRCDHFWLVVAISWLGVTRFDLFWHGVSISDSVRLGVITFWLGMIIFWLDMIIFWLFWYYCDTILILLTRCDYFMTSCDSVWLVLTVRLSAWLVLRLGVGVIISD